jgi:hypothetical protein
VPQNQPHPGLVGREYGRRNNPTSAYQKLPALQQFTTHLAGAAREPWLRALWRTLDAAGTGLMRTLTGFRGRDAESLGSGKREPITTFTCDTAVMCCAPLARLAYRGAHGSNRRSGSPPEGKAACQFHPGTPRRSLYSLQDNVLEEIRYLL